MTDGESVRSICEAIGLTRGLVWRWADEDPVFAGRYTRAREAQAEAAASEVLEVADAPAGTSEEEQRRRVRVDARKWYASKVLPRTYGERQQHTHDGAVNVRVRYDDEQPQGA